MISAQATDIVTLPAPQAADRVEPVDAPSIDQAPALPYRDVRDVRLNQLLSITALALSALLVVSLGLIIYLATRPPQQVVIERSSEGDRVIAVNGQAVRNGVAVGADKPGANDKKTIAREWVAARYGIDPMTREKDLERMFRMMSPNAARAYANLMKGNGELERENAERWQAVWKPQVVDVDRIDPYRINIVGRMEITKKASNGAQREEKQIMFGLRLIPDTGRAPRNMQTGFLVDDILDLKELPVDNGPASALTAQ
jgi:hypothetical protein